jgi:hypothetical protein
LHNRSSS